MLDWIERVWKKHCIEAGSLQYLLLDHFKVHLMQSTVSAIQDTSTRVDFIPAGYTNVLQVLDVGVNKDFKVHLRAAQDAFLTPSPMSQELWCRIGLQRLGIRSMLPPSPIRGKSCSIFPEIFVL